MTGSLTLALNHTPFVITEQSQLKVGKHIAVNIELLQSKCETTLTAIARHALRPCRPHWDPSLAFRLSRMNHHPSMLHVLGIVSCETYGPLHLYMTVSIGFLKTM